MDSVHVHLDEGFCESRLATYEDGGDPLLPFLETLGTYSLGGTAPDETTIFIGGRPAESQLSLPRLEAVIVPFAGIPEATVELLREHSHIRLYNLHHNASASAELAVGLLIAAARRIVPSDQELRRGIWEARFNDTSGVQLAGKTACIFGFGEIGQRIGVVLEALGMTIIGVRRQADPVRPNVLGQNRLQQALAQAHALVIAAPLTNETKGVIGMKQIELLRPPRLVVNVGRGLIVDEAALFEACRTRIITAAGIDVWYRYPNATSEEPVAPSSFPFETLENVVMSPHQAGAGDSTEVLRTEALIHILGEIVKGKARPVRVDLGY